ncbi:phospholipase A2 [Actinoplanes sp. CA-252034]|uniref:phospholipase A2 n=1 Tax=Actinoplanes sp. CA-252034 TaxID=3239906 RepID=UPI003D95ED7D
MASPAAAAAAPSAMSAAALDQAFNAYGNTGGEWTSGDSTVSIPLPDGRNAWLFSDTLIGAVGAGGTLPENTPMINNSLVVQDGSRLVDTRHGGTAAAPKSLVQPADGSSDKYWVGDGTVEGSTLRVVYQRMRGTGAGPLDFALLDSAVVTFDLPALTVRSVTDRGYGNKVAWGSAVVEDGAYTYIYGAEDAGPLRFAHLARVPAGGLAGAWQFWTGTGWSDSAAASARVMSGVGAGFGVHKVDGSYVLVTQEANLTFSPDFVAYTATSPTGPFTGPVPLFTAPEPANVAGSIVYDSRLHQELAPSGKLLVSYNVNSLEPGAVFQDVTRYRPRFVEVDWPRPVPDAAQLPAAPTNPVARADGSGFIHLGWQAPAGSGLTYSIFQRDVTAGQTHLARVATGVTGTTHELNSFYRDGHRYEFKVAAVNATGTGPQSATAATTVTIAAPVAPTGLTAVAADGGTVKLDWSAVPDIWRYEVFRRDLTAGETEAVREWDSVPHDTTHTVTGLENGHQYAFHVVAVHGGGESPASATATATAFHAAPAAVTGLTATAQQDGSIKLTWAHTGTDTYFSVYQRNVTVGEDQFTKLLWPVMECCTMTAGGLADGQTYEYRVTANNRGGESALSTTVSATAAYPRPAVPTNLTAAAQSDGTIKLTWQDTQQGAWYYVHQRDVTAGETEFTKLAWPVTECCTMTAGGLVEGHTYAYVVSSLTNSGESAVSAEATAVADLPAPAAPTSLRATAGSGEVVLTWDGSADNWHVVMMRDVTAGESGFTKLAAPVTTCCTMTAGYLTNGHRYEFKVAAVGTGGESAPSNVVTATPLSPPPAAPTGLTAAAQADGTIKLTWSDAATGNWYQVYQRDVTAGEAGFTKLAAPVTTCCSMIAGYLANGHRYEYKVAALNGSGGEGPTGNVVTATSALAKPAAPTNLRGQTAGPGNISLAWDAPAPGLMYWVYQRDVTAGEAFTKADWPNDTNSATRGFLADGHVYEFKVTAVNQSGEGPASATVQVTARGGVPQPPTSPQVTAGDAKATLTWQASPTAGAWYQVYLRNVSKGQSWQKVDLPVTTCCTFTAGYLTNGDTYEFRIAALNGAGESAPTVAVGTTPFKPRPAAPSGLTVSAGDAKVVLSWTKSPTADVYYVVWLRDTTTGQSWRELDLPVTSCCSMTAGYLVNGHDYEFKVAAANSGGQSGTTNVERATPLPPKPQAPSGLSASPGDGKVSLSWSKSSTPNVFYEVDYRKSGASSWSTVRDPISSCCSFVAGYLSNGQTYEFRVRATNEAGSSSATNVDSAKPMPPKPQAPSGLSATAGDGKVTLKWTKSPTSGVGYWVEYKPTGSPMWTRLKDPYLGCCTFVAGYLTNGVQYDFRVMASNMSGNSAFTNVDSAKPMPPKPNAPTNLKISTWLHEQHQEIAYAKVDWNGSTNTNTAIYQIHYRNVTYKRGWEEAYRGPDTVNTSQFWGGGSTYEVKIEAINMSGSSFSAVERFDALLTKPALYSHLTYPSVADQAHWEIAKARRAYPEYKFDWSDNGCSSPIAVHRIYNPSFFNMACQRHDFGYGNHGWWGQREHIDRTMLFDMLQLCSRRAANYNECREAATIFYAGVDIWGEDHW